jgi:outer membrane immunogenic protein
VQARRYIVLATCAAGILLGSLPFGFAAAAKRPAPRHTPEPVRVAPVAPVSWTGFYLGAQVGFDFATARLARPQAPGVSDISIGSANRGLIGGGYAGFNYQAAPWLVVGVEGDLNSSRANYRELGPDVDFLQASKSVTAVGGRVGIVAMPTTMVYAKAGPAWIDVQGVEGFGTPFQKTLRGAQVAAGVETLVTPNFALRTEGSYTRATETLLLNQGLDQYRPAILQIMVGGAYKLPMPGIGTTASRVDATPFYTKAPALYAKAPPAVASARWTGVEVGAFGSVNGDQMRFFGPFTGENNEQGPYANLVIGGGGFVGFNAPVYSNLIAGVEGSANFQKADFNDANGVGFPNTIFHFASINQVYAFTVRLGWLATPSTLIYVKAGPALIRVAPDNAYWSAVNALNGTNGSTKAVTLDGYQYGGGAETFLTSYLSVRVEGVYTGSAQAAGDLKFLGVQPTPYTLRPSLLSGTLGAALHF